MTGVVPSWPSRRASTPAASTARRASPIGPDETADELRGPPRRPSAPSCCVDALADGLGEPRAAGGRADLRRQDRPRRPPHRLDVARRPTIHRLVRVGGAWTTHHGKRLKVWRTRLDRRRRARAARGPARGQGPRCRSATGPTAPAGDPATRSGRDGARPAVAAAASCVRIDSEGAYANLVLRHELDRSGLDERDRAFVTDLVYGTTRLRRRLDHLVDRFLLRARRPAGAGGAAPRRLPAARARHAAARRGVGDRRRRADRRARGLVNAVLRKVADAPVGDDAGRRRRAAVVPRLDRRARSSPTSATTTPSPRSQAMNEPASATERDRRLHAGPRLAVGGRARRRRAGRAGRRPVRRARRQGHRAGRDRRDASSPPTSGVTGSGSSRGNVDAPGSTIGRRCVVADATAPPLRAGVVRPGARRRPVLGPRHAAPPRRRPLAHRRPTPSTASPPSSARCSPRRPTLVRPGGTLVYSVCTLTAAEGPDVAATLDWPADAAPGEPWRPWGSGALLLPQTAGTDGMFLARWHTADGGSRSR